MPPDDTGFTCVSHFAPWVIISADISKINDWNNNVIFSSKSTPCMHLCTSCWIYWYYYEFVVRSGDRHVVSYYDPARLSRRGHSPSSYLTEQLLHTYPHRQRQRSCRKAFMLSRVSLQAWLAICRRALDRHCVATCTREINISEPCRRIGAVTSERWIACYARLAQCNVCPGPHHHCPARTHVVRNKSVHAIENKPGGGGNAWGHAGFKGRRGLRRKEQKPCRTNSWAFFAFQIRRLLVCRWRVSDKRAVMCLAQSNIYIYIYIYIYI